MIHQTARALAGAVAASLLMAGCSSDSEPLAATSPSASPSTSASADASASASASPSSTLSAEEQQAVDEATKVVLAYRQTITDLYSGARTNLNDLNEVAAGDQLVDKGLAELQRNLSDGWTSEPKGAQLALVSAEPVKVDLLDNPDTVVVRACVDGSAVTGVAPDGQRTPGAREQADYTLTRTSYLPEPGWAVTRVKVAERPEDRKC